MSQYAETVDTLRRAFDSGITRPLEWRLDQLRGLQRMLAEHADEITEVVTSDVGKPADEVRTFELAVISSEVDHFARNLKTWLSPRRVGVPSVLQPATAHVQPQPLGVVLVMSPWNYPVQLLLSPIVGALAAGNTVLVKPSEVAARTSALMARLLPRYVDERAIAVVEGGVAENTALLTERFDHIVFTGSTAVGRVVMKAAAEHLTPVTLELGGKSPVFVDRHTDLVATARRIAWAKFTNAGQTCVAPDHVYVTADVHDELVRQLGLAIRQFFGDLPRTSPDLGRIVNTRQFDRLHALLPSGTAAYGGESDRTQRYIAPTVLTDVAEDSPVMAEEIFGPILPVLRVADAAEAIARINARPKPLALYVFSDDKDVRRAFRERTSSGGLVEGAALVHLSAHDLPFGGVGESGMGRYHGQASIDAFSHLRSVMTKPLQPDTLATLYPPAGELKRKLQKLLLPVRAKD
ncbi:aldehyde dehydrogenase family protein [Mariniluteicoccus endophyticus]